LRPLEEFQRHANHQDHCSNTESITNQLTRTQNTKEKARTTNLTRFNNLPTSSRQKEKDLIQPTKLQELQKDV